MAKSNPVTFFEYAENDYSAYQTLHNLGQNYTAVTHAAQACEKYAKHLILFVRGQENTPPQQIAIFPDEQELPERDRQNFSHRVRTILEAVEYESNGLIQFPIPIKHDLEFVGKMYYRSRYPAYDWNGNRQILSTKDVQRCDRTIKEMRVFTKNALKTLQSERDKVKEAEETQNQKKTGRENLTK